MHRMLHRTPKYFLQTYFFFEFELNGFEFEFFGIK